MISQRTRLSLCQYLDLQNTATVAVLLEKHGLQFGDGDSFIQQIKLSLSLGTPQQIESLLEEVVATNAYLSDNARGLAYGQVNAYNQRWKDLIRCLELDGYRVEDIRLVPIDPTVHGSSANVEDDLSRELSSSQLVGAQAIQQAITNAIDAFHKVPAEYNACLGNARVAFETLARAIALQRRTTYPGSFDESSWGQIIQYLRTSEFITKKEEEGLTGVYSFISPGAHTPLGLGEEEMARLGLSLALSMCYFLIRSYNRP